ncbi:MAG: PHP domain-containing protein [Candidatus Ventricola sp.]
MKADLHLHTTASDGTLSPETLAARAAEAGFDVIAVSDHDSVDGIPAAREAARGLGLRVLTGVELSCGAQGEIHVLGYGFDPHNRALTDFFALRVAQRQTRAERMVQRLTQIGKPVSLERVRALAGGVVARPHVAQALVEAGHAASVQDAFERYLKPGKPGFVPKDVVRVAEAVQMIHAAGGVSVLAHPMELGKGEMALEALVHEWHGQGLDGLEVYHPSAANNHAAFLHRLALREGLLVTGGSDYHGPSIRHGSLGQGLERWTTVEGDLRSLLDAIERTA